MRSGHAIGVEAGPDQLPQLGIGSLPGPPDLVLEEVDVVGRVVLEQRELLEAAPALVDEERNAAALRRAHDRTHGRVAAVENVQAIDLHAAQEVLDRSERRHRRQDGATNLVVFRVHVVVRDAEQRCQRGLRSPSGVEVLDGEFVSSLSRPPVGLDVAKLLPILLGELKERLDLDAAGKPRDPRSRSRPMQRTQRPASCFGFASHAMRSPLQTITVT